MGVRVFRKVLDGCTGVGTPLQQSADADHDPRHT